MFLCWGDSDLGIANSEILLLRLAKPLCLDAGLYRSLHKGEAREAKDSALLSSRDAGLLEPPERPQGSPYRASPSLAAKNIINLILMSTIW